MSSDFKFLDLVHFLHRLNNVKRGNNNDFSEYGRATITQIRRIIIEEFVSDWRHHYHQEIPFLKVLRMVLPDKDTSRKYNMKETSLINSILQAYGVTKQSEEYRRLNNGHIFDNHREKYIKARKVATAMAEIISKRQPGVKGGVLTLLQVDEYLDLLSLKLMALEEDDPTNKSPVKPFEVLRRMFALMNHDELELAILIILKYKIIGHSQTALLRSWHKDAPEYFSAVMSLEAVCNRFEDPESILAESEKSAQVLLPFSPQLAFHPKSSYEEIVKAFNGEFFIEEKLDGERLQLHMKRTGEEPLDFTFRFYSRKGTDYTENYGADMTSGTLAPYMREVIDEKRLKALQSLILDGEVMGYDTKRQVVLPFGTLKAVNIEAMYKESSFRPVYVIFDVLMINGRALGNTPLSNKKALLLKLINPKPGYIEVVHSEEAHSVEDIKNAMKDAVEANSEGIMVKQKSSRYKLGARDPCWVKIKPEYLQELGSDLDLVVIGKITQKKTSYFCGLRVDNEDGSAQNLFYSFCKIANGIGSSDLEKIESLLSQKWHKFEEDPPPENILQFGSTKPSYWIDPQNSIVLQVKARSIEYGLYGRGYKVGSTIISGYMKSIRDDKSWKDALSLGEFMDWQRSEVVATSSGRSFEARKKVVKRQKVDIGENPLSFVSLQSDLFINLNFMILSDYKPDNLERLETSKLQQLAKSFGATVCVSERNEYGPIHNLIPLATKNTLKVHSLYNMGYDIIHCSWLLDCIGAREILPFEPRHCFRVLSSVYEAALKSLDNKGDGFFSNLNSSLFEKLLENDSIVKKEENDQDPQRMYSEEEEFWNPGCFSNISFFLVKFIDVSPFGENHDNSTLDLQDSALEFKFFLSETEQCGIEQSISIHDGTITEDLSKASFVVVPTFFKPGAYDEANQNELQEYVISKHFERVSSKVKSIRKSLANLLDTQRKLPRVVNEKFILASIEEDTLVDAEGKLFIQLISSIILTSDPKFAPLESFDQ